MPAAKRLLRFRIRLPKGKPHKFNFAGMDRFKLGNAPQELVSQLPAHDGRLTGTTLLCLASIASSRLIASRASVSSKPSRLFGDRLNITARHVY